MKKILAIVLAIVVVVAAFAACGGNGDDTNTTHGGSTEVTAYEGTFEDLVTKLYETNPVEFMAGPAMAMDLADLENLPYYTGLSTADGISEAAWSESMLGSQPYSLVLVRAAEGADIEAIKTAMFNGINTRKWICVEADQLRVVSSADVIMLVMAGSEFAPGLADKMVEAFTTNVGELTGETLTRG